MVFLGAVQSTFTIAAMIIAGYVLTSKGWFSDETADLFSKMIIKLSLPAFMFSNFYTTFTKENLMVFATSFTYPLLLMMFMFVTGIIIIKVINIKPGRKGIYLSIFALSNTLFVGLPVNISLFGEASIPHVILFYTANTVMFWTVGVYAIRRDNPDGHMRMTVLDSAKRIISPPLVTFALTIVIILLDIRVPGFILDTARYFGNLTTPMSMLFIGMIIHSTEFGRIKIDREMIVLLVGRFIIAPLTAYILLSGIDIPTLMKKVFIIEAAMPAMTQTAIVAKAYGSDHRFAAVAAAVTTTAGMAFIPIYMVLLSRM